MKTLIEFAGYPSTLGELQDFVNRANDHFDCEPDTEIDFSDGAKITAYASKD